MKSLRNLFSRWLPVAVASFLVSQAAIAGQTWNLTGLTCSGTTASNSCSNSSVSVTAWSTTGTGTTYSRANIGVFGGGLGVRNATEAAAVGGNYNNVGEPDHAMDNSGQSEFLLIQFLGGPVTLQQLDIGWSRDSDLQVYAGNGSPLTWLAGKTATNIKDSWTFVSNLSNWDGKEATQFNNSVSSSWWLISAYNSTLAKGGLADDGSVDAVKLLSVSGFVTPPSNGSAPEPGSLALAGMALAALAGARRHRKAGASR